VSVDDLGDGFTLTAQSVAPIDPGQVCKLMQTALERLVDALEAAPEMAVKAIDVMSEAERRQTVGEWDATEADYPRETCVHELFEQQTRHRPDGIALVCEGEQVSYGELEKRSNQLAAYLRAMGVGPEMVVGLCVERSTEMVVAMLGILKAGGAYLP